MFLLRLAPLFLAAVTLFLGTPALAQEENPCAFKPIDIKEFGMQPFQEATTVRSQNGWLETDLRIQYATNHIGGCEVYLRNYNGLLVGPTLRVKPGDTMVINLKNLLPEDHRPYVHNKPGNFNITNLHTHGLHVSPAGNSDNVLLEIGPGETFQNEIKIPRDHPPGTFWYHAHVHGSTALQVSSGMAGAIIIEGGMDTIPSIAKAKDLTMMIQQISYDETGRLENYDNLGPGDWEKMHRSITVNGQIVPVIRMRPGEVQRWRLIHGGVRESLYVNMYGHKLHEIAVDGLALGYKSSWDTLELQPGYRSDVLVKANPLPKGKTEMEYLLLDAKSEAEDSLHGLAESEKVLAVVVVAGPPMDMALPTDAELAPFRPHPDITPQEVVGEQKVVFSIETIDDETQFMINGRPFTDKEVRTLTLNRVEAWHLSTSPKSLAPNHPFHIHVNPFQYTRKGPKGEDQVVWRDTLMVEQDNPITVYSRYERYIGKFVLHCHILDHEDQGMMELVEIVEDPNTTHGH